VKRIAVGASITLPTCPASSRDGRTGNWSRYPYGLQASPAARSRESFFKDFLKEIEAGLMAAMPLDAVLSPPQARLAEGPDDPEGDLFEWFAGPSSGHPGRFHLRPARQCLAQDDRQSLRVRGLPRNPHVDIYERGVEAARTCANAWPARHRRHQWSRCRWCRRRSPADARGPMPTSSRMARPSSRHIMNVS